MLARDAPSHQLSDDPCRRPHRLQRARMQFRINAAYAREDAGARAFAAESPERVVGLMHLGEADNRFFKRHREMCAIDPNIPSAAKAFLSRHCEVPVARNRTPAALRKCCVADSMNIHCADIVRARSERIVVKLRATSMCRVTKSGRPLACTCAEPPCAFLTNSRRIAIKHRPPPRCQGTTLERHIRGAHACSGAASSPHTFPSPQQVQQHRSILANWQRGYCSEFASAPHSATHQRASPRRAPRRVE